MAARADQHLSCPSIQLKFLLASILLVCSSATTSVHVVFGNHLDIGFDNIEPLIGYDNNVLNKYFNEYLPRAASIAAAMQRASPHGDRYVYTTHSYLLSLFLDCPPGMDLHCPNATTVAAVTAAIRSGAITWHAHPHNAQYELYDPSLLAASFELTHELDRRFGLPRKHTAILRDVPGLTRASIPVFVSRGIKAISVGVNAGSAPPGVPRFTPFVWRDQPSGTQILAFWHPGGYGGMRDDLALDPKQECIQAPGLIHVLCTSWRNDNSGPPEDVSEPLLIFDLLRQDWMPPTSTSSASNAGGSSSTDSSSGGGGARVFASSFDAFVDEVLAALPSLNLPVVTEEIGDTWVFGVQSDPLKTANFRAASRLRAACIADPACPSQGPEFRNFTRLLLKVPEHTWGVDIKKTLHDFDNYSNTRLHACLPPHLRPNWAQGYSPQQGYSRQQLGYSQQQGYDDPAASSHPDGKAPCPNYGHCIKAWARQAAYVDWALQALPADHWVRQQYAADLQARQQLAAISPQQLREGAIYPTPSALHQQQPEQQQHQQLAGTGTGSPAAVAAGKQRRLHMWQQQQQQRLSTQAQRAEPGATGHAAHSAAAAATAGDQAPTAEAAGRQQESSAPAAAAAAAAGLGAAAGAGAGSATSAVRVTGSGVHQYWCGSWRFEVDEAAGAITSLVKFYGDGSSAGTDWARGDSSSSSSRSSENRGSSSGNRGSSSGVLGQLMYSAYCEASYDDVWEHYAWHQPLPWWFPLDFGKVNSSAAWDHEEHMQAKLVGIYETSTFAGLQQVALRYSLPQRLVREVGAPQTMWTIISCPAADEPPKHAPGSAPGASSSSSSVSDAVNTGSRSSGSSGRSMGAVGDDGLHVAVVWQEKTPTRIPEALWFSFRPAPGAVDDNSWRLHKIGSSIHPHEVMLNGSRSMHAVSDAGVSVSSAAGDEVLHISTLDTALVSPGAPTPLPQGRRLPDMQQGVHFNLVNNLWGTNYIMWVPYSPRDRNMSFRFTLNAHRKPPTAAAA